jgi:hypothetical protein
VARRVPTPPQPTSTLALISTGEVMPMAFDSDNPELGGTIVEKMAALRPVTLDELPLEANAHNTHNLGSESDPLSTSYTSLTHPQIGTEPFRPYLPHSRLEQIRKQTGMYDPRLAVMGRVLDIDIDNTKPGLGAPDVRVDARLSLVDEAWVSGSVGMVIDAADAASQGQISPFRPLLTNEQRDVYMVWQRDMSKKRHDNQPGEWVLRSVVSSTDPHPEDALMWTYDFDLKDPRSGIKTRFVDPMSLAEHPEDVEGDRRLVDRLLGKKGDGEDFEKYVSALARAAFRKDYDPDKDNLPSYVVDQVKLAMPLLDIDDNQQRDPRNPLKDFWRLIVPAGMAKMVSRTAQMLDELKSYRHESVGSSPKAARKDEAINRRQIAQSFVAAVRYYSIIRDTYTTLPSELRYKFEKEFGLMGQDVPEFKNPMMLDLMLVDDIDRTTVNPAKMADFISNKHYPADTAKNNATDAVDKINRRAHDPNGNDFRFVVRTWGKPMRVHQDLKPGDRNYSETPNFVYTGKENLEASAMGGVYPDEIIRSVVDPINETGPADSRRFGLGGLAMTGVVAMIEVDTETGGNEAYLITNAKDQPHIINRAVLGQFHADERTAHDIHRLLVSGETGLTQILAAERAQRYRLIEVKGKRPQDIVVKTPSLRNGDSLTLTRDENGDSAKVGVIIKSVRGQEPATRRMTSVPAKDIAPGKAKLSDVGVPTAPNGRVADTSIVLANNRVYVAAGRGSKTTGTVNLYKRSFPTATKKGRKK